MNDQSSNLESVSYWGGVGLERADSCIACAGTSLSVMYDRLEDMLGGLPGQWGFDECRDCKALNLQPRPTPMVISKAYPEDYVTHADGYTAAERDNGTGPAWAICNGYLNARFGAQRRPEIRGLTWALKLLPPIRLQLDYFYRHLPLMAGRVLDVGCGNGAFLHRAKAAGWEVLGIDPDPAAVGAGASGVKIVHSTIDEFTADSEFDYVTLSHVFEHLHKPQCALDKVFVWLRSGGCIWMSMPNPSGIGRRIYGRNWFSLDPPRHLCLPTQLQVKVMLEKAGFTDVEFLRRGRGSKSSIIFSQAYAAKRGESPSRGAWLIAWVVDLLSSFHACFAEELVVRARRP